MRYHTCHCESLLENVGDGPRLDLLLALFFINVFDIFNNVNHQKSIKGTISPRVNMELVWKIIKEVRLYCIT